MSDIAEQIERVEKEIRQTPYHKGTERHIGILRAKLAKLRDRAGEQGSRGVGGGKGGSVRKQGDATVVLVGPPSAGKSTLLNELTNANSRIAPYAFTTVTVVPGMMKYREANIQILDVPGLIEGAEEGKGRGREVLSVVRGADLLIIMTDAARRKATKDIVRALESNGIRINKARPSVRVYRKLTGGLIIHSNIKQEFGDETVKEIVRELGVKNAEVFINEKVTLGDIIDVFSGNRIYTKALFVINKSDELKSDFIHPPHEYLAISAKNKMGIGKLKEKIWETLGFITVYLVKPGEGPHKNSPIVVKKGITLSGLAETIGSDFQKDKSEAKIWGDGAKYPGQTVSLGKTAEDGMMIRFV